MSKQSTARISASSIEALVQAVFDHGPVTVVEAYSAFDSPLQYFAKPDDLLGYVETNAVAPNTTVHVAIHYPNMGGRLTTRRIELNQSKVPHAAYRYAIEGWGLIWIYLDLSDSPKLAPFVSANSESRALKWQQTYPDLDPPTHWCWPAVETHARRLRRVLRNVLPKQGQEVRTGHV